MKALSQKYKCEIFNISEDQMSGILKHYNMNEEDLQFSIQAFKDWIKQNDHFPQDLTNDDERIIVCLLNAKMSLERAKKSLEGYFSVRTMYDTEFYDSLIPNTKLYEESKKYVQSYVMPNLLPNLNRLTVFKIIDINGEASDAFMYYIIPMMLAELRILGDRFLSNELLVDVEHNNMKNLIKYSPTVNNKLINIQNAINLRVKYIHVVNATHIFDKLMFMLKSLMPAKIIMKIVNHKSYEDLQKYIPKEHLPSDYGGTERSSEELQKLWCDELEKREECFKYLKEHGKSKVALRKSDRLSVEMDGSFKRLSID